MQKLVSKNRFLMSGSTALLLGLSLPVLASCGMGHEAEGHAEMMEDHHGGEHDNKHDSDAAVNENDGDHHEGGHGHDSAHGQAESPHSGMITDTVKATVTSIDVANGQLTLDHEALTNIGMDAMIMGFQLDDGVSAASINVGDKVMATVAMKPGKGFVITRVEAEVSAAK